MREMVIRFITLAVLTTVFGIALFAQSGVSQQSGDTSSGGGVIFKIPNGMLPMDWKKSGFKGILMLQKESPSGIFVGYPNDNESVAAFKERAVKFIAPMFVHDPKEAGSMMPTQTDIPSHEGDSASNGRMYVYASDKSKVQILFYERGAASGKTCVYGYFSSVSAGKENEKTWADEKGQGVKIFEKFWKSFKN